jgi:hypothetical protein
MEEEVSIDSEKQFNTKLERIVFTGIGVGLCIMVIGLLFNSIIMMGIGTFILMFSFSIAFYFFWEYGEMELEDYGRLKNAFRFSSIFLIVGPILLYFLFADNNLSFDYYIALILLVAGMISMGAGWLLGTFRKNV